MKKRLKQSEMTTDRDAHFMQLSYGKNLSGNFVKMSMNVS